MCDSNPCQGLCGAGCARSVKEVAQPIQVASMLDLDSDEPLSTPVCSLRPQGLGEGETCEACQ